MRLAAVLCAGLALLVQPACAAGPAEVGAITPACAALIPDPPPPSAVPAERPVAGWRARVTRFNRELAYQPGRVLFLGDSIIEQWDPASWTGQLASFEPHNLGISGDRTQNLIWRIRHGHLRSDRSELAVVMIGTNNAGAGEPAEAVAAGVAAVLRAIRAERPEMPVLLLAILPREASPAHPRRQVVAEASRRFAACADGKRVRFLDTGSALLAPDGRLDPAVAPDGLHLSAEGYRRWAAALAPVITQMLARF